MEALFYGAVLVTESQLFHSEAIGTIYPTVDLKPTTYSIEHFGNNICFADILIQKIEPRTFNFEKGSILKLMTVFYCGFV